MPEPTTPDPAGIAWAADRILGAQNVLFGSVAMDHGGTGHPVPPMHVAAVLHGLADYTLNRHMVDVVIDGQALAQDPRAQAFQPRTTSLGRFFHALGDAIERTHARTYNDPPVISCDRGRITCPLTLAEQNTVAHWLSENAASLDEALAPHGLTGMDIILPHLTRVISPTPAVAR